MKAFLFREKMSHWPGLRDLISSEYQLRNVFTTIFVMCAWAFGGLVDPVAHWDFLSKKLFGEVI